MSDVGWKARLQGWVREKESAARQFAEEIDEAQQFVNTLAGEDLSAHPLDSIVLPLIHLPERAFAFPRQFYKSIRELQAGINWLEAYDARVGVEHPIWLDGVAVLGGILTRIPEMSALMIEAMPELFEEATQAAYSPGTFFPFLCRTLVEEPFLALSVAVADFIDGLLDPHASAFSQGQRIVDSALYAFSILDPGIKGVKALKGVFDRLPSSPPAALVAVDGSIGAGTIGHETVAAAGAGFPLGLGIGPLLRRGEDDEGNGKVIDLDPSRRRSGVNEQISIKEPAKVQSLRDTAERVAALEDDFLKGSLDRARSIIEEIDAIDDPAASQALERLARDLFDERDIQAVSEQLVAEERARGVNPQDGMSAHTIYVRVVLGEKALAALSRKDPAKALPILRDIADGQLVTGDFTVRGNMGYFELTTGTRPRAIELIVACLKQGNFGAEGIALLQELVSRLDESWPVERFNSLNIDWRTGRLYLPSAPRRVNVSALVLDYAIERGVGDLAVDIITKHPDDAKSLLEQITRRRENPPQPLRFSDEGIAWLREKRAQIKAGHYDFHPSLHPDLRPSLHTDIGILLDEVMSMQTSHPQVRAQVLCDIFKRGNSTLNTLLEVLNQEPDLFFGALEETLQSGRGNVIEASMRMLRDLIDSGEVPSTIQDRIITFWIDHYDRLGVDMIDNLLAGTGHPRAIQFFEERLAALPPPKWFGFYDPWSNRRNCLIGRLQYAISVAERKSK